MRAPHRGTRRPWSPSTPPSALVATAHAAPSRRGQTCAHAAAPSVPLGAASGVTVSRLILGCMQFGEALDTPTAHKLISTAIDAGITAFDTAEMYPVPPSAATAGASERVLGSWLASAPVQRDSVTIITKVAGPGSMAWLRGGPARLDGGAVTAALDGSLGRLGVDCVDCLLLHWPDRYVPMFGAVDYDPTLAYAGTPFEDVLEAAGRAITAGKLRSVGVSNETAVGLMSAHAAAAAAGLPAPAAISNAYSLLARTFDSTVAEAAAVTRTPLLAYAPHAAGLLTGKYEADDGGPPQARLNRYRDRYAEEGRRYARRDAVMAATRAYCAIAQDAGMTPAELALRWVLGRPTVAAAVVGATADEHIVAAAAARDAGPLPTDVLASCDDVHARWPSPAP